MSAAAFFHFESAINIRVRVVLQLFERTETEFQCELVGRASCGLRPKNGDEQEPAAIFFIGEHTQHKQHRAMTGGFYKIWQFEYLYGRF